jgi:hypothetical protein
MIREETLPSWKHTWRNGIAPNISTAGLVALSQALEADDPRLIQGVTTSPPPLMCVQDWPVEAADAVSYPGWIGDGLETVGQVEEYFARICFECDNRLGEPAACRWFLNWWDDTPRNIARRELLSEVEREIGLRQQHAVPA